MCIVSGVSSQGHLWRPISALSLITDLRLPDRSYKAIYVWLLPVLDLESYGGDFTVNRVQEPSVLGWRQVS